MQDYRFSMLAPAVLRSDLIEIYGDLGSDPGLSRESKAYDIMMDDYFPQLGFQRIIEATPAQSGNYPDNVIELG